MPALDDSSQSELLNTEDALHSSTNLVTELREGLNYLWRNSNVPFATLSNVASSYLSYVQAQAKHQMTNLQAVAERAVSIGKITVDETSKVVKEIGKKMLSGFGSPSHAIVVEESSSNQGNHVITPEQQFVNLIIEMDELKDLEIDAIAPIGANKRYSAALGELVFTLKYAAAVYWSTDGKQTRETWTAFADACLQAINKAERVLGTQHTFWNDVMIPLLNGILKIVDVIAKTLHMRPQDYQVSFFKPAVTPASKLFKQANLAAALDSQLAAIAPAV